MGKIHKNTYDNPKIILNTGGALTTQASYNDLDRLLIFAPMKHSLT
jgi:hypothetical protein